MRRMGFSAGVWTMLTTASMALCIAPAVSAAELKPATVAAFDRYERVAEAAIASDVSAEGRFLRMGSADPVRQPDIEARLRRGEVVVEGLHATEGGKRLEIPSGMVHHWVGAVFVPGVHVDQAVALLRDYDRHAQVYRPALERSSVLETNGDRLRIFLRLFMKKVIAVTVNTESVAEFAPYGIDRVASSIRSTRIAEVEDAGQAGEREKPVGRDGGYLWRLNTYWRFLERGGGTYIECESITLTRDIPLGFGWLVGPFVTSIPRETLTFTLDTTRRTLLDGGVR